MRYRSLKRVTSPVVEPVSLTEARTHCRVDSDEASENTYLMSLVAAAREWVEDYIDRSLVKTEWQMRLDKFPPEIELPRPPMLPVTTDTPVTLTYTVNQTGQTATLSTASYRVDSDSTPGVLRNLYGGTWPSNLDDPNSITVTWWAGYGEDGRAVPTRAKHAMLMLVGHWYERRLAADNVAAAEVPFGVKALLDSVSWGSYT
jgi:uncharacterized phiE125 gp8 family phage protein